MSVNAYVAPAGTSSVAAPPSPIPVLVTAPVPGGDVLTLTMSEDAWQGDAQFTIAIDGVVQGGIQTTGALNGEGQVQTFSLGAANLRSEPHTITIGFLNDAWGGSSAMDRNLYLLGATLDGVALPGSQLWEYSSGWQSFSLSGSSSVAAPLPPAPVLVTSLVPAGDVLALTVSEDAWQGDVQFTIAIDGVVQGGVQTVTALNGAGQTQIFDVSAVGLWSGPHTVTIDLLNGSAAGSPTDGRNLYILGATLDGHGIEGSQIVEQGSGRQSFSFAGTSSVAAPPSPIPVLVTAPVPGGDVLTLTMSEDAWQGDAQFTIAIDGVVQGGIQTTGALNGEGQVQTFSLGAANLRSEPHTITIGFLNDAWGGSSAMDRNLYLLGATLDGVALPGSQLWEYSSGWQSFSLSGSSSVAAPLPPAPVLVTSLVPAGDVLALTVSEDAWQGDVQFTIAIDGVVQGGVQTVTALNGAGQTQIFDVSAVGLWSGPHTVTIDLLNGSAAGSPTDGRNLYILGATLDGHGIEGSQIVEQGSGRQSFSFAGTSSVAAPPSPIPVLVTAPVPGGDVLTLTMSEDAWQGDAQFTIAIDGVVQGGIQTTGALNGEGQVQTFSLGAANLRSEPHTITIGFLNDAWGGSSAMDRNLYLLGATLDGVALPGSQLWEYSSGWQSFSLSGSSSVAAPLPPAPVLVTSLVPAGDVLALTVSEDAWQGDVQFTIAIDGVVQGGVQTVTALNGAGQTQIFDVKAVGLWSGPHTVTIDLLNGSAAGSPTNGRNLYILGATLDGHGIEGSQIVEQGSGRQSFSFAGTSSVNIPILTDDVPASESQDNSEIFYGQATPGTAIQLAEATSEGYQVFTQATVGLNGMWSARVPLLSLGFGKAKVVARTTALNGDTSNWTNLTSLDAEDPVSSAKHVGAHLQQALRVDADEGLDATADLQKLADEASGKEMSALDIPAGTYLISATIFLNANTIVDAPGVTLKASSSWHLSSNMETDSTIRYAMLANTGFDSPQTTSGNIEIRNVTFDWNGINSPGSAAVRFVNTSNILVDNCSFDGSEDGVALMGVHGGVVMNSTAMNTTNYGFDNWGGPIDTVIKNNVIYASSFGGISITGELNQLSSTPGYNNTVIGNHIYNFSSYGIDVDTLNTTSPLTDIFISGNFIDGPGRGIQIVGPVTNGLIYQNLVYGTFGPNSIYVSALGDDPSPAEDPHNIWVIGNVVSDSYNSPPTIATIRLQSVGGGSYRNTEQNTLSTSGTWLDGYDQKSYVNVGYNSPNASLTSLFGSTNSDVRETYSSEWDTNQIVDQYFVDPISARATTSIGYGHYDVGQFINDLNGPLSGIIPASTSSILITNSLTNITFSSGNHTVYLLQSGDDATIDGGTGDTQLVILGGQSNDFAMADSFSDISELKVMASYPAITSIELNSNFGLQAWTGNTATTIAAGGLNQTIYPGIGCDTMIAFSLGNTTFAGTSQTLGGDKIIGVDSTSKIDITDMLPSAFYEVAASVDGNSVLYASDGFVSLNLFLQGSFSTKQFTENSDGGHGVSFMLAK